MEKINDGNPRARSKDKKDQKFEEILLAGMELFVTSGPLGFTISDVAKKVGLKRTSLYTYVKDKNQLRTEIINYCNDQFTDGALPIINTHKGGNAELFYKFCEYFFEFAEADLIRYNMMFAIGPPRNRSENKQQGQRSDDAIVENAMEILKEAEIRGEIDKNKAEEVFYFTISLLMGGQYMGMVQEILKRKSNLNQQPHLKRLAFFNIKSFLLNKIRIELNLPKIDKSL